MKPATLLLMLCFCSCCSSSSSAAVFFAGLIPRTGPHFRKVTGIGELTTQAPFINDFSKGRTGKKTDKENKLQVENIRKSNPDGVAKFCATAKKIRATRTTPPYNQPGDILTIGGMKKSGTIMTEAMEPLGASMNYVEIAAREFCGM
tara:strand:- start:919 stop:1359 length:441 start_codon:yes stop_codon:yes gene_type:complete